MDLSIRLDQPFLIKLDDILKQFSVEVKGTESVEKPMLTDIGEVKQTKPDKKEKKEIIITDLITNIDLLLKGGYKFKTHYIKLRRKEDTIMTVTRNVTDTINEILISIEKWSNKKLLFIIDDFEKARHHDFFTRWWDSFDQLACPVILSMPQNKSYASQIDSVTKSYSVYLLPIPQVEDKDGSENESEIELLNQMVRRRVSEDIIPDDIVRMAAKMSGGVISDLFTILQQSLVKALSQKLTSVNKNILNEVFSERVGIYRTIIDPKYYKRLEEIQRTKNAENDEDIYELLSRNLILEYRENSNRWYVLNPAVVPLIKR